MLWKFKTGSGVVGSPITWEQDGEQYVAVVSGWGGAVPLWGGEVAKKVNYLKQGGMRLGVQAPQGLKHGFSYRTDCDQRAGPVPTGPVSVWARGFYDEFDLASDRNPTHTPEGKRRYNGPKKPPCARF